MKKENGRTLAAVFLVLVAFTLSGCAATGPASLPQDSRPAPRADGCTGVYVALDSTYSLDTESADGLTLLASGEMYDVPVYCTEAAARAVVHAFEAKDPRCVGLWQVYRVDADWDADVSAMGDVYHLKHPARVYLSAAPPRPR